MPSSFQSLSTITVFDYEYPPGDPTRTNPQALRNQRIRVQLDYSQSNTTSPQVNLQTVALETLTDQNGYWQFNLVPNSAISPANTTYLVETPSQRYTISVPNAGPVQSSTIKVGTPVTLTPVPTTVGPLTVNGAFTVNTGPVSLPAGSVGVAALAGILPIANGGTGSGTQNFVDLTTNQTVAGTKTFSAQIVGSSGAAITGAVSTGALSVTGAATATGEVAGTDFKATGITGAAQQVRVVGRSTVGGAPTSGTFAVGDIFVDGNQKMWICTVAGTPPTAQFTPTAPVRIYDSGFISVGQAVIDTGANFVPSWALTVTVYIVAQTTSGSPQVLRHRINNDAVGNHYTENPQWSGTTANTPTQDVNATSALCGTAPTSPNWATTTMWMTLGNANTKIGWNYLNFRSDGGTAAQQLFTEGGGFYGLTGALTRLQFFCPDGVVNFAINSRVYIIGYPA